MTQTDPFPASHPAPFREIAENLQFLDDWEERFRYIIELGQALPELTPDERNEHNKVHGCVSQVWLVSEHSTLDGVPVLTYRGESDAMIVRGLVAVLIALYSGRPARDIARIDAMALFDDMGLRGHLTAQRSNGLSAMVTRIRSEAEQLSA